MTETPAIVAKWRLTLLPFDPKKAPNASFLATKADLLKLLR